MNSCNSYSDVPTIPVSWGELVDKITILEIKASKINEDKALVRINDELASLTKAAQSPYQSSAMLLTLKNQLKEINLILWEVEDEIRMKESKQEFDSKFIELARKVYHTNDRRSAKKREIDVLLDSRIVEQKKYASYQSQM